MTVTLSPKRVTLALTIVVVCLTLANLAAQFSRYAFGPGHRPGLVRLFDVDQEGNIPTWFASATLLVCSVLLATIAHAKKRDGCRYLVHWRALSVILLLFSLDEVAQFHESQNRALRVALEAGGLLYNTWIILGTAFALVVAVAYRNFLADLPGETRRLFLTAGSLYVGGTLGLEAVGGWYTALYGQQNMTYALLAALEELLEMMGVVVFIYALMSYMSAHLKEVRLKIGDERSNAPEM